MGYSYNTIAGYAYAAALAMLQGKYGGSGSSNAYHGHFHERGREQKDGAITGVVHRMLPGGLCRRSGSYRVSPDGVVERMPGLTLTERNAAAIAGYREMCQTYGRAHADRHAQTDRHPARDLASAAFLVV